MNKHFWTSESMRPFARVSVAVSVVIFSIPIACYSSEASTDILSLETFKKASGKEKQEILSKLTRLVLEKRGLPDPWTTPKTPQKAPSAGAVKPSAQGDAKTPTPPFTPGAEWTPLLDHISKDPLDPEILSSTQALFVAIGQWSPQCEAFCSNLESSKDPRFSAELYRVRDLIMALDGNGQVPLKKVVEIALRKGNPEDWKVLQTRYGTSKEFKAELLLRIDPVHKPGPSITAILKLPEFNLTREEFAAVVRAFAAAFRTANDANRRTLILQFQRTCEARFPELTESLGPVEVEALQALLDSKNDWEKVLPIELVLACAKTVPPQFLVRAVTAMRDHKNLPAAGVLAGIGFVKHERTEESKAAAQSLVPLAKEFRPDAQTGIYSYCRRVLGTELDKFELHDLYLRKPITHPFIEAKYWEPGWKKPLSPGDPDVKSRILHSIFKVAEKEEAHKFVEFLLGEGQSSGKLLDMMVEYRAVTGSWKKIPGLREWLVKISTEESNQDPKKSWLWPRFSVQAAIALHAIFQDKSGMEAVIKNIRESKAPNLPRMLDQWTYLTNALLEMDPKHEVLVANLAAWTKAPPDSQEAWWGWVLARCLAAEPNKPAVSALAKANRGGWKLWRQELMAQRFGDSLEAFRNPAIFFSNLSNKNDVLTFLGELDRLYFASQAAGKAGTAQLGEEEDKPGK